MAIRLSNLGEQIKRLLANTPAEAALTFFVKFGVAAFFQCKIRWRGKNTAATGPQ